MSGYSNASLWRGWQTILANLTNRRTGHYVQWRRLSSSSFNCGRRSTSRHDLLVQAEVRLRAFQNHNQAYGQIRLQGQHSRQPA